jgi:2,3-bisphosphoglycerate-dependent phosphoglycerate mutase
MRRFFYLLFILQVACLNVFSQENEITTLILLRHAEKVDDGTKDPSLSAEGIQRAEKIALMLSDTKIDGIYSTNYKRTQGTAMPLSKLKGVPVSLYEPLRGNVIDEILDRHKGGTVVIVGHSNTIPWTANYVLGKETYQQFADGDYGNLLLVSIHNREAKVVWLNY